MSKKQELYFTAIEELRPDEIVWRSFIESNVLHWQWAGAEENSIGGTIYFKLNQMTNVYQIKAVETVNGSNIPSEPMYIDIVTLEEASRNISTIANHLLNYIGT